LTLNQLVRGSSPRPATSGFLFFTLHPCITNGHINSMTGTTITVPSLGRFYPMKTVNRKGNTALRAWSLRG